MAEVPETVKISYIGSIVDIIDRDGSIAVDYYNNGLWNLVGDFPSIKDFINTIRSEEWKFKFYEISGKRIRFWFTDGGVYIIKECDNV